MRRFNLIVKFVMFNDKSLYENKEEMEEERKGAIALYCIIVLNCTALDCSALYSTPMYCNLLYSFILYYTELYFSVLHCTELYFLHCTDEKYYVYYDDNHLNATTVLCLGEFSST